MSYGRTIRTASEDVPGVLLDERCLRIPVLWAFFWVVTELPLLVQEEKL